MRFSSYYKKHTRSLLLSKFIYIKPFNIIKLTEVVLSLGFKKDKLEYGLALVFLFLITHTQPTHELKFLSVRGKKKIKFNFLKTNLRGNCLFILIEKLNIIYFPNLENWVGILNNFKLKNKFSYYNSINITDFSIFYELDFLVNFNYGALQSFSKKWFLNLFFLSEKNKSYEITTLLRSLQFPSSL